jgi:phage FluMu protein Com
MDSPTPLPQADAQGRRYLGVQFVKCRTYGRLYLNAEGTAYFGRCPRCGAPVRVPIGEHGTSQRFFIAVCP